MFNYHTLSLQEYADLVVSLISSAESHRAAAANLGDGQVTIGYGYTFGRDNNLAIWQSAGIALTPAEVSVLQQIDAASTLTQKNTIAAQNFTRHITKSEARALLLQTYSKYEGPADSLGIKGARLELIRLGL